MGKDEPKELLFLCALQNAVKHGGVPQAGAVIGIYGYSSVFLFGLVCLLTALGIAIVLRQVE